MTLINTKMSEGVRAFFECTPENNSSLGNFGSRSVYAAECDVYQKGMLYIKILTLLSYDKEDE